MYSIFPDSSHDCTVFFMVWPFLLFLYKTIGKALVLFVSKFGTWNLFRPATFSDSELLVYNNHLSLQSRIQKFNFFLKLSNSLCGCVCLLPSTRWKLEITSFNSGSTKSSCKIRTCDVTLDWSVHFVSHSCLYSHIV